MSDAPVPSPASRMTPIQRPHAPAHLAPPPNEATHSVTHCPQSSLPSRRLSVPLRVHVWLRKSVAAACVTLTLTSGPSASGQAPATAPTTTASPTETPSTADLYEVGKALFDQLAPPEIKEQFEFPSPQQFDEFATRFQRTLRM